MPTSTGPAVAAWRLAAGARAPLQAQVLAGRKRQVVLRQRDDANTDAKAVAQRLPFRLRAADVDQHPHALLFAQRADFGERRRLDAAHASFEHLRAHRACRHQPSQHVPSRDAGRWRCPRGHGRGRSCRVVAASWGGSCGGRCHIRRPWRHHPTVARRHAEPACAARERSNTGADGAANGAGARRGGRACIAKRPRSS